MIQFDDIGSSFMSLPPNLQTTENDCFSYAMDKQIRKLHKAAQKLTVWSNLDNVDPKYYDYLAVSIRAPYYKSEYSNKQKLKLIKSAIMTMRYAGTIKAIDELLAHAFKNATFIPWFEYGGEPYHFKVTICEEPTEESKILFEKILQRVKAARSIVDGVEIDTSMAESMLYIGMSIQYEKIFNIPNKEKIERRLHSKCYVGLATIINKEIMVKKGGMTHDEI